MMGLLVSKNSAAFFVAVLLLLPGCIPQRVGQGTPAPQLDMKKGEVDLVIRESEQDFRKRDFDGALKVYRDALRKYPDDRRLHEQYLEAAENIRNAADDAFAKEEFARSGRTYAVLLKNYPHFKEIAGDLSFERKYLRDRLRACADRLSERALTMYRQGNLAAAISLWKNILEFEPGNAGVRKAIDTATTQLKNLQQKTE